MSTSTITVSIHMTHTYLFMYCVWCIRRPRGESGGGNPRARGEDLRPAGGRPVHDHGLRWSLGVHLQPGTIECIKYCCAATFYCNRSIPHPPSNQFYLSSCITIPPICTCTGGSGHRAAEPAPRLPRRLPGAHRDSRRTLAGGGGGLPRRCKYCRAPSARI